MLVWLVLHNSVSVPRNSGYNLLEENIFILLNLSTGLHMLRLGVVIFPTWIITDASHVQVRKSGRILYDCYSAAQRHVSTSWMRSELVLNSFEMSLYWSANTFTNVVTNVITVVCFLDVFAFVLICFVLLFSIFHKARAPQHSLGIMMLDWKECELNEFGTRFYVRICLWAALCMHCTVHGKMLGSCPIVWTKVQYST